MFFIKGKVTLLQYFLLMLFSTIGLVAVTFASYLLPYDKSTITILMAVLSILSVGSSAKIIADTANCNDS
jgi:glucose-6-phosphate-specific signal transduction histidine kinase